MRPLSIDHRKGEAEMKTMKKIEEMLGEYYETFRH